jgi:site-specific DNA-methyltransferase (adenine-specific)
MEVPTKEYFTELFRISKNQIIWGGNYLLYLRTRCFLFGINYNPNGNFCRCEFAWTSFDKNAKIFKHVRNTSEKERYIQHKNQ